MRSKENMVDLTYAQKQILKRITEKNNAYNFQDHWTEYDEYYDSDYNDCHGDYYDSE